MDKKILGKQLGKRLNTVRKEKGITSEALSEKCEATAVFIRQIESGVKLPSIITLVNICNALNISPDYLLADSLEAKEQGQFNRLLKNLRSLSPKQLDVAAAMIAAMVDKSED